MNTVCKALLLVSVAASATASSSTSSSSSSSSTVRRTAQANEMEVLMMPPNHHHQQPLAAYNNETARNLKRNIQRAPAQEERDAEAVRRRARLQERRQKARTSLAALSGQADAASATAAEVVKGRAHRLTQEQVADVQRRTSWFGSGGSYSYNAALGYLADPAADYDKWAQAYRMLGAFVDCDHDKDAGSQDNGGGGDGGEGGGCSRWMMWAAVRLYSLLFLKEWNCSL